MIAIKRKSTKLLGFNLQSEILRFPHFQFSFGMLYQDVMRWSENSDKSYAHRAIAAPSLPWNRAIILNPYPHTTAARGNLFPIPDY
jgi:hypothetical protein